jgi:hypothetical protein
MIQKTGRTGASLTKTLRILGPVIWIRGKKNQEQEEVYYWEKEKLEQESLVTFVNAPAWLSRLFLGLKIVV